MEVVGDGVTIDMSVVLIVEEHLELLQRTHSLLFRHLPQLLQPVPDWVKSTDIWWSRNQVYPRFKCVFYGLLVESDEPLRNHQERLYLFRLISKDRVYNELEGLSELHLRLIKVNQVPEEVPCLCPVVRPHHPSEDDLVVGVLGIGLDVLALKEVCREFALPDEEEFILHPELQQLQYPLAVLCYFWFGIFCLNLNGDS